MTTPVSRSGSDSKREMIETALTLFDQSLALLARHLPAEGAIAQAVTAAPLPSLLERCETHLEAIRGRRGPRLACVMPGLPHLDPAWWRLRLRGVQCLRLPDAPGHDPGQHEQMLRGMVGGLWQQAQQDGRELLLLATPETATLLDVPAQDRIMVAAHPWPAFCADAARSATLDAWCDGILRAVAQLADLRIVMVADTASVAGRGHDAMSVAARGVLEALGLGPRWRDRSREAPVRFAASDGPDPALRDVAPAYIRLCVRLGVEPFPVRETPEAAVPVAAPARKAQVSGTIARIARMGVAGVPDAGIEAHLWGLADHLDRLLAAMAEFPDRLDALARALPPTDGALLKILAAGHFVMSAENLQAMSLLAEAMEDMPQRHPAGHDLRLLVASLQLDLQQPRLAVETMLGSLTGLAPAGERALAGLAGADPAGMPWYIGGSPDGTDEPDSLAERRGSGAPERMIVACHHKSGTNFLRKTFDAVALHFGKRMWYKFYSTEPAAPWDLCFHQHGRIHDQLFSGSLRGVHCVRHPMALVMSAALYHEKCAEPWVDVPLQRFNRGVFEALTERESYNVIKGGHVGPERKSELLRAASRDVDDSGYDFAGKTYRQMLAGYETLEQKVIFEMNCFSRGVVRDMVTFPSDRRFARVTLEGLSHDRSLTEIRRMFRCLGFSGSALETCVDLASANCIWNMAELPKHATTGVSGEWKALFRGRVLERFRALFGFAETALGYGDHT